MSLTQNVLSRLIEKDPETAAGLLADYADRLGLEGEDLLEQLLSLPFAEQYALQAVLRISLSEEQRSALLERLLSSPVPQETLPELARALQARALPEEQRVGLLEGLLSRPVPEEALPELARALQGRVLPEEQRAALLEGLLSRPVPQETLPELARALQDNKPQKELRSELLNYLLSQPIPKELLPTLAEALLRTKPEKALRAELLEELLNQPIPGETLPKLQDALLGKKLSKNRRIELLAELISGDEAQGAPSALVEAIAREKPGKEQRSELLRWLLAQPIPGESVPALTKALTAANPGKEQRTELLNWLLAQPIPGESITALAEALVRGKPGKEQRTELLNWLLAQPVSGESITALIRTLTAETLVKEQREVLLESLLRQPIPDESLAVFAHEMNQGSPQKSKMLELLEAVSFNKAQFYGFFYAFLVELERIAPRYQEPTVVFFGHMADRRKLFYTRLADQLGEGHCGRKVLFVNRGPAEARKVGEAVLQQLNKYGLLKIREERGSPKEWKSRLLKLDYTDEMRALVEAKPYLRRAIAIAKGAFGETAPDYPEVLMCLCYRCYDALLSRINVASICLWNGFRFNHYLLAEMCRERGIEVSFMEFGSLPGTLAFDRRGQMGESAPSVEYEEFRQLSVTEEELARAEETVAWLKTSGLNRKKQPGAEMEMEEKEELKRLRPDRPVILFAGQWDVDSGMVPYTEHVRKYHSPVFESSLEAVLALAKIAEKHDWNLIFKPHPSVWEEYDPAALPDNVIFVKKYNINDLIDLSDVVVTILSSTGYVSLIRDRATVMLGYNQLRSKDCTYDAFRPEDVESALAAAVEQGYTAQQRAAFIRHVAQMCKYYLYQDGEEREGPVYGRPLDQMVEEFRPISAETSPEKEADALFDRELRRILSALPGKTTRDAQAIVRRSQSFRKTYRLLAPWADRDRPAWKDGLSAAFRRAVRKGEPEETVFLDLLCEGQLCYLDGACMEFIDRKRLWLMFREILFNEEYDCDFETDEPFVLDCGTNIGLAIYYIKHRWPKARVVGFEPWSVAWGCAQRNAERNGWSDVVIHQAALGPEKGTMTLTSMMENTLASTLTRRMDQLIREREYDALTEEVPVTPLSPYLDRRVDFLKMDIEGMEAQVLRECGDGLDRVERIFCEYHYGRELEDNSLAEILQLLEDRGFCFEVATASAFAKSARHRFAHTGQNISELVWAKRIGNGEEEKDAE